MLVAGMVTFLTGCWQKSLEPFYTQKDLIANPSLIGTWTEADKKPEENPGTWTFSQAGEKRYSLTVVDGETTAEFEGRLFKLGDSQFLDLYSRKRALSEIPAHHLVRIAIQKDAIEMSLLSMEWVNKWVSQHPKSISHTRVSDPEDPENTEKMEIVLTAPTAALQKFVLEHQKDEDFFDGLTILKRSTRLAKKNDDPE